MLEATLPALEENIVKKRGLPQPKNIKNSHLLGFPNTIPLHYISTLNLKRPFEHLVGSQPITMNAKELRASLKAGHRVYGTLIVSDSPRWPAAVSKLGLDFVFIDTEHIAIDRKMLSWMCQAYAGIGLAPIVRISSPDPYLACMALDGGAAGIIAPYVETVEQVRALRGAVKLRPIKGARLEAALNGSASFPSALSAYQQQHAGDNLLIVNIESQPAIDNLDALLAEEGIDAVLIGPHDLSCNLGIPERYDAPEFNAAVQSILRAARARGVGAGIHYWMGLDQEIGWMKDGMNFIVHSGDIFAMKETLSKEIRALRSVFGDKPVSQSVGAENI